MNDQQLKHDVVDALWQTVDRHPFIQSATLTGSFATSATLEGLSDIDFVVIVDQLDRDRFQCVQEAFDAALRPVLASYGFDFKINSTLGPLKFNAPNLAVLHLMLYSVESHIDHVIQSPFTCLDWQRSAFYRGQRMADVYPTFALQPRHFISARRSISDYLKDFRDAVVSYRSFEFDEVGCHEVKQSKPMTVRDRHEFAYHVMRFLMLNLLKLIRKYTQDCNGLEHLLQTFHTHFPANASEHARLLSELATKKRRIDFTIPVGNLDQRLEAFVQSFEQQFRAQFVDGATRHVLFRHAPTAMNLGPTRFLGHSDPELDRDACISIDWEKVQESVERCLPKVAFVSPLQRTRQTMQRVLPNASLPIEADSRLIEINYGDCESKTVQQCRLEHPELFDAWSRAEDPRFPNGENSEDVCRRALDFANSRWASKSPASVSCTHNVVLRSLLGHALQIPESQRHRLRIPHCAPITVLSTRDFGWYFELDEAIEREIFSGFASRPEMAQQHAAA